LSNEERVPLPPRYKTKTGFSRDNYQAGNVGPSRSKWFRESTLTSALENLPLFPRYYINADLIKKNENISDYDAMTKADKLRTAAMSKHISFAFETVMSHHSKLDFIDTAKHQEYKVILHFVLTEDPSLNVDRVALRHTKGGHDVPVDKIIDRYHRSINFLKYAFKKADIAYVYNNSWAEPIPLASKSLDGKISIYPMVITNPTSKWTENNIRALLDLSPRISERESDDNNRFRQ
jgi:predicted ABC-type ATPase